MRVAALSDVGRTRQVNEDSCWTDEARGILLLADGMGGHAAGEIASSLAVRMLSALLLAAPTEGIEPAALEQLLTVSIDAANQRILEQAESDPRLEGMGTTLVAALCGPERIALAHIGDSRAYLYHQSSLFRLTRDHSIVAELVDAGEITPAEARVHRLRSVLTRCLGQPGVAAPDLNEAMWQSGGRLLLCSDGLTVMLDDPAIESILSAHAQDPDSACRALIAAANAAGGTDNISVVLAAQELDGLPTPDLCLLSTSKRFPEVPAPRGRN
jgi:PPM family protein phosphatase